MTQPELLDRSESSQLAHLLALSDPVFSLVDSV